MPASKSVADVRPDGEAVSRVSAGDRLRALLRILAADPSAIPALGAVALLIAWAANQAGYPQTHWAPGGIILLALLAIAIGSTGIGVASIPSPVRIAIGAMAAYTAFSFLSILWANVPGDAWEGADRALLYLIVFALFASFRRGGAGAALLLAAWTLAMAGLAVFTVLHVNAAAGQAAELREIMPGGRLIFPAGYANANAAMWMIAFFPAWLLAAGRNVPIFVRGLLAGGAVVLSGAALYSQSRGSVYSIPILLALVFLLLPGRARNFAALAPIAIGVGACAPTVLRLDERLESGVPPGTAAATAHAATFAVLAAGIGVSALVTAMAAVERRWPGTQAARRRVRRGLAALGVLMALVLVVGGVVAVGRPIGRVEHAWNTFTSIKGYAANGANESRLTSGFGSDRYDFYRVAWHEFLAHPVLGIGADNFAEQYLRLGRGGETPRYPHSVELRTLAETGVIGAIVALVGMAASMVAIRMALKARSPLSKTVAGAAVAGFGYWAIHGSFDWFYEYAGLGAAAFALLGLACSLAPGRRALQSERAPGAAPAAERRQARRPRRLLAAGGLVVGALAATAFAAPWLSRMEVQSAAKVWTMAPASAYAQLHDAGALNPLSAEPNLIAGTIALRLQELDRARRQFTLALRRSPGNAYATLELGAIASTRGEAPSALRLLQRAVALIPRSPLARQALASARAGERVNINDLNRSILREAHHFP